MLEVPSLSLNTVLEPATQQSSAMSIYSSVDHNTPPGFINQPMNTFNDLSQLTASIRPPGFAPELDYWAPSDESLIYSSNSCYSPNPEYSHTQIAGQSYLLRHDSQPSQSLTPHMGPCYQPPLYTTLTLPAWYDTETSLPPQELQGTDHFEGSFLQSVGTPHLACPSTHSASSENADELPLCFDAPLIHGVNNVVNKKAETNEKAEAVGAAEEAQRSDPAQAVNHLLRKWTTLFDMPFAPSWDSGRQSAVL